MNTTSAPAQAPTDGAIEAVRAGRTAELPDLLKALDRTQRRDLLVVLKRMRGELRTQGWDNWQQRALMGQALVVAGAGCHTGAAAAAAWIGAADMRRWQTLPTGVLLDVLADRDPQWLGDLAHRLAARASTVEQDYALIIELVRITGCPMPTTDGCVEGWAMALDTSRTPLGHALRDDPHVTTLVPRLFETAEPVRSFGWRCDPDDPDHWPAAVAGLAEAGIVDRAALLDGCTARLLRGGKAGQLKPYQAIWQGLRPTEEEERERAADWIALTADAPSPVAGHAQRILARLAAAGHLTPRLLAEMSAAVLFRPEKKLVRAQLVLMGKELRRDPATAPELLAVLGEAFGHTDTDIQERALKLAAAHLTDDPVLRAELAGQAQSLSPAHRTRAVELLGQDAAVPADDAAPYQEFLPPPPLPAPLAPAPGTVPETVELVAAVINSRTTTVEEFERALDGLVRHAHRDRAALNAVLRPALADQWWLDPARAHWYTGELAGLAHVAAAVMDARPMGPAPEALGGWRSDCHHTAFTVARQARLVEAARHVTTRPLPFLLATPTGQTGTLDPQVLVERLTEYGRLGEQPAPVDFAQALLRVRRDASAVPAAAALGTPEGDRLAAWLGEAGEAGAVTRRTASAVPHAYGETPAGLVLDTAERTTLLREFPEAFHELAQARKATSRCWDGGDEALLIAALPEDRETLAAWWLPAITACAVHEGRGGLAVLPGLAAAGGPAGPALHLAVATGLGARHPEDRLRAADALLTLAAREELDAGRLGADLGELLNLGTVKPNRLADSLRTSAATGACATTWAVLAAVLPALLTGTVDARGAGDLLATAADCVEQSGTASPEPAGLAEAASRPGRSRLVTQASRLRDALRRNAQGPAARGE
ncbi:DUF6493 family protein [Streptomyces sp. NBC_00335]|uniref:DUF7824 domain-containing protein n=1 Tax=unclassified Streptomyces TaxID=2593676 RepID=UPI00224D9DD2|nr:MULTISPECIES: DUF6493 family protein [unclassified Streptomyces]MCX5402469.1 DUF6493 family protein [Streptomyces sp. NBC_00086]